MRLASRVRPSDIAIVALFIGTELGVLIDTPEGSRLALYLFPALWTLPLLFRRRWPIASSLVVIGALTLEGRIAYNGTESQWALFAILIAFFTLGRHVELSSGTVAWGLGVVLGGILLSSDTGGLSASSVAFLAIASVAPFAAGAALRAREGETLEAEHRAERLEAENEARADAAVAEERARIARELHDMIGHAISVITVQAGAARLQLDRDPSAARAPLIAIEETGQQTLDEMRRLIGVLRDMGEPGLAPQPGLGELERLAQGVRDSGLDVELRRNGQPSGPLPPDVDLAAYRIVQEALTNALKHGGDSAVVTVGYSLRSLRLEIESSGGRPPSSANGGRGLVGMRERVELCGGELEAAEQAGGGYAVRASLPLAGAP
jgi:signal transduction histidine kinase